jgi:simple sugar transport system ATP-binding protein
MALKLTQISKSFGGARALKGIDWDVAAGEVHCLVGENGCGKSTLIKIVAGVHAPDADSSIELGGRLFDALDPATAKACGVQVIFQDLSLFPNLSVAENIAIDETLHGLGKLVRRRRMREIAAATLERLGFHLPLDVAVAELTIAERQIVAICRGLAADARILFMDEPTASLTRTEVDSLLGIVARLKSDGISVIFVSHRLDEVVEIADRVTVMRDGLKVGTWPAGALDEHQIAELMTGESIIHEVHATDRQAAPVVLQVDGLSRVGEFEDVSLTIREGEVLGLIGLLGAGRTELALTLFGMRRPDRGSISLNGRPLDIRNNRHAIEAGIAYVSEDRLNLGLNIKQSVADNLVLSTLDQLTAGGGLISQARKRQVVDHWIQRLRIKVPGPLLSVGTLSGGNQQRVVLAKWLATKPKLLILDSPTVGVDIGNKASIYALVRDLAREGVAILLISDEIPEVYFNCDRVLHMRDGRIRDALTPGIDQSDQLKAKIYA